MTLSEYLDADNTPTRESLSKKLGITRGRLSQLERDTREGRDWPAELALKVEEHTGIDASSLSSIIARARQCAA
jgi:transcriptional regulator with XRE-family HTH domain